MMCGCVLVLIIGTVLLAILDSIMVATKSFLLFWMDTIPVSFFKRHRRVRGNYFKLKIVDSDIKVDI